MSFRGLAVFFTAHISSWGKKKKNKKQVNSTGYKSSLTYSMTLSPGGREGSGNIENLSTMDGTRVGERKEKSQHWASMPPPQTSLSL